MCRHAVLALLCLAATAVSAQDARVVEARVVQIAGATLYLDQGTDAGLVAGDTLEVDRAGSRVGRLVIVSAAATRAVATSAGAPFAVTRGETLHLRLGAVASPVVPPPPVEPAAPVRASILETPAAPAPRAAGRSMRVSGRVQTGVSGSQSSTQPEAGASVARSFATPFAALRADVTGLPGGATFRLNGRLDARYASGPGLETVTDLRLYGAALELPAGPVALTLGRFASPRERVSGFWDGADAHLGSDALGAGVLVGVQPARTSGLPDVGVPKAAAYAHAARRTGGAQVRASATAGALLGDRRAAFAGGDASLRGRAGRTGYSLALDVLADDGAGGWGLARASLRASAAPGPARLGVAVRRFRPSVLTTALLPADIEVAGATRESVTADASVLSGSATLYVDGGLYRTGGAADGHALGGGLRVARLPVLGLGASLDVRLRDRASADAQYASLRITRQVGATSLSAGTTLARTVLASQTLATRGLEGSFSAPLTRRTGIVVQGALYTGGGLQRTSLYTSLWMRL